MTNKKTKFWKKSLHLPVFHWNVDIVVTENVVQYGRSIGYEDDEFDSTTNALCMYFPDKMKSVIILEPLAKSGTIAHECWHAVRRMLLHVGAELDNEVVAYHLGYLVQHAHDFMGRKRT